MGVLLKRALKIGCVISCTGYYAFVLVKGYYPGLIGFGDKKLETVKKISEEQGEYNYKLMNKQTAKRFLYANTKTRSQIDMDIYFSYIKDTIKFAPPVLSAVKWSFPLYCGYVIPVFVSNKIAKILKVAVRSERPDGWNNKSFPSGHSTSSFVGVGYLLKNFHPAIGLMFGVFATGVVASRVYADRHRFVDVVAGGIIGILSGLYMNSLLLLVFRRAKNFYAKRRP